MSFIVLRRTLQPKLAQNGRAFSVSSKVFDGARVMVNFEHEGTFPAKDKPLVIKKVTEGAVGPYAKSDRAVVFYVDVTYAEGAKVLAPQAMIKW